MSRSAAEWNQQSQQQPNPTYPMMGIAPPQPAQLINGVYTTVMQQPYGMVPMQHVPYGSVPIGQPYGQVPVGQPYGAVPIMPPPPQPFVPIPLTGDDEDNIDPALRASNVLPMHGSEHNFNMNTLLHSNIMESEYFRALYQLKTYHEVIDEIYRSVGHVEAWQVGTSRIPSTCFCLLLKFMLMKLTLKQMKGLLETEDSAYVRAIGFMYLRYTCPPKDLWKWYEPFLEDDEEIHPSADTNIVMTVGEYCIKLITDMSYFGTTLPRIPIPIERKMKVMLLLLDEKKRRRRNNEKSQDLGAKVKAIYSDDENEPCWYEAVIDSVALEFNNKYWVTFPEYGNSECIDLGDMELIVVDKKTEKKRDDSKEKEGKVRDKDRNEESREGRDRDREKDKKKDKEGDKDRGGGREKDGEKKSSRVLEEGEERSSSRGKDRKDSSNRGKDRGEDRERGERRGGDDKGRWREGDSNRGRERGSERSKDRDSKRERSRDRDSKRERERSRDRGRERGSERERSRDRESKREKSKERGRERSRERGSEREERVRSPKPEEVKEVKEETLMEKVLKSQRDAVAAIGRNYGNRPASYKGSLALKVDRYTVRKKSQSPERGTRVREERPRGSRRSRSRSPRKKEESSMMKVENTREQQERMKKLRDQYGDASAR